MEMNCRLCGSDDLEEVLRIEHSPHYVQKLLNADEIDKDFTTSLTIVKCRKCNLIQLTPNELIKDNYYNEGYFLTTAHSSISRSYQKSLAKRFINRFSLREKSILEVGGDGLFSKYLMEGGAKVIMVESSAKACEVATQRDVSVINAYFDRNTPLEPNSFDAFVTRQVLEHIDKPTIFLQNIQHFLKSDAVGIVEVPNILKTLKNGRYYDFYPEHLVYYNIDTLFKVLVNSNFEVLDIFLDANDEYIVSFIKNSGLKFNNMINQFAEVFSSFKREILKLVDIFNKDNKKIAVWGAGGKGIASLSFCELTSKDIKYVVDSGPNKWNKFTPGSKIKIEPPDHLLKDPVDVVIIGAVIYRAEIITRLRKELKFKGFIVVLVPIPHILSEKEANSICQM